MTLEQLKVAHEPGPKTIMWIKDSTPRAERVKGIWSVYAQLI